MIAYSLRFIAPLAFALSVVSLVPAPANGADPVVGSITGRVVSTTNAEIEGLSIQIEPGHEDVTILDDGSYQVRNLEAGFYTLVVSAAGYIGQRLEVEVRPAQSVVQDVVLVPAHRALGEITVNSSFSLNRSDPAPGVVFDRQQLLDLPHVGDDVIRVLPLLPGVASGDTSARFNVRGGLYREVLYQIDGLEIYEPFHLKDFDGVFSIIDPRLLDEVQLLPGAFTAEYGDRSSAVLDLTTVDPKGPTAYELGVSFTTLWANAQGDFDDGRGRWFGSVRRGFVDLIMSLAGPEDSETERSEGNGPAYWDVNGKLSYGLASGHDLTGRVLWSREANDMEEWENENGYPEYELWDTTYGNASLWVTDSWVVGNRTHVNTIAYYNRLDRDRIAAGEDYAGTSTIRDERELEVLGLRQDWSFQAAPSHFLKAGLSVRNYDTWFDYENSFTDWQNNSGGRLFAGRFQSTDLGLYAADRFSLGPRLTAEVGLRWDRYELLDEDHVSPRLNLVWSAGPSTIFRLGWGHFYQSQRPHELQVEDGETEFWGVERAEHRLLGFERWWGGGIDGQWSLRAEVYQRLYDDVRPRYENLFEPFQLFPETSYDRYRIAPDSAEAIGAELFLTRRGKGRFDWWVNYSWSEVTDRIGDRDVPRQFDQTHAFAVSGTWRPSPKWTLAGVWIYHTGWPTTAVSGILEDTPQGGEEIVVVLGPINAERLPDYHRLDLRVARRIQLKKRGSLELFLDLQNAYGRLNVSGYEVDDRAFTITDDGEVIYTPRPEEWWGTIPSFGVSWSF